MTNSHVWVLFLLLMASVPLCLFLYLARAAVVRGITTNSIGDEVSGFLIISAAIIGVVAIIATWVAGSCLYDLHARHGKEPVFQIEK